MHQRRRSWTTVLHDPSVPARVVGHATQQGSSTHRVHTGQSVFASRAASSSQQIVRYYKNPQVITTVYLYVGTAMFQERNMIITTEYLDRWKFSNFGRVYSLLYLVCCECLKFEPTFFLRDFLHSVRLLINFLNSSRNHHRL